jgi:hypothetical protein
MLKIEIVDGTVALIKSDSLSLLELYADKASQNDYVVPCFPEDQDDGTFLLYLHRTELEQITRSQILDLMKYSSSQPRDRRGRFAGRATTEALTNIKEEWFTDKKGRVTNVKYGGPNQEFRLSLTTRFGEGPTLQVLMFNPSKGGHDKQDKTLVMTQTVARKNGFGAIHVVNLYTVREQNSIRVPKIKDKGIVPFSKVASKDATHTLLAFGSSLQSGDKNQAAHTRKAVKYFKSKTKLVTLGLSKSGAPKHPVAYPTFNPSGKFENYSVTDES